MSTGADDFEALMRGVLDGSREAAERLCREYEAAVRRAVRTRLPSRLRARYDSVDFVNDVWASFFAHPPCDARLDDPKALIGYLTQMARHKLGEARRSAAAPKRDLDREVRLEEVARADDGTAGLPDAHPTPSQIVGAEDVFEHMVRDRPPAHRKILTLLRQGMTHREIADLLQTTEKTVYRLVRNLKNEEAHANARTPDRPG
jgi:RNA polymerase sigma factor (sigma-70 family)